jgi:hypothetical protein
LEIGNWGLEIEPNCHLLITNYQYIRQWVRKLNHYILQGEKDETRSISAAGEALFCGGGGGERALVLGGLAVA